MAVMNFLAPFSICIFASVVSMKSDSSIYYIHGVNGFGLNTTFATGNQDVAQLVDVHYPYSLWHSHAMLDGRKHSRANKPRLCNRMFHLILSLGGDIHVNPGPNWKYPCAACKNPVKANQDGILWDDCELWFHPKCVHFDENYYIALSEPRTN